MKLFMRLTMVVCVLMILSVSPVVAETQNPFGFDSQVHPLQYEYCKNDDRMFRQGRGYFVCQSAPRPHPTFRTYTVQFVHGVGLCRIEAMMDTFFMRNDIKQIADQIARKYGAPTDLKEVSDAPAKVQYSWKQKDGFPSAGNVTTITLHGIELDNTKEMNTWIEVDFSLKSKKHCLAALIEQAIHAF